MASITIRNLNDDTKKRLRLRAAEHGRSLEAEVRDILDQTARASKAPAPMNGLDLFKPIRDVVEKYGSVELEIPPRTPVRDPEFGSVKRRGAVAEDSQPFRAPDKPDAKTGIAESIRRRFAPFGGVELEPFPDEILIEARKVKRKSRRK